VRSMVVILAVGMLGRLITSLPGHR